MMRRGPREITDTAELAKLIAASSYAVLCMVDGASPYAVPVNFGYDGEFFYVHCATQGKKLEVLAANPAVQLSLVPEAAFYRRPGATDACACTMHFSSVNVAGQAELLTDPEARQRGLRCIVAHFGQEKQPFSEKILARTALIRITPSAITGKRNADV